jgi:plasmid maintenance system killer protein
VLLSLIVHLPQGQRPDSLSSHVCHSIVRGDLKGFWSIRVNDQWRLCFRFVNSDAVDVEIVDYH